MKHFIIAALFGAVLSAAPAALAQGDDNNRAGGYIGFAGGLFYEDSPPAPSGYEWSDEDDAGNFRLYGGYRWEAGGALEASVNIISDLKLDCSAFGGGEQQTVERGSVSFAGLYHFQLGDRFSVFPKLGLAYADIDGGNEACIIYPDDSGLSVVFGGGAEFRLTDSAALRVDVDKGTSGLDDEKFAWTAGVSFYF